MKISVIMPAKNEGTVVGEIVNRVLSVLPNSEVIVVDDGSTDDTQNNASIAGAKVISHPYSKGNGAAIKTGARSATGDVLIFMDADAQHDPSDIIALIKKIDEGYDMVVGARDNESQASVARSFANRFYNGLASWITGQDVKDLTSGFRAVKAHLFSEFLSLLPNGFSYPTTSTMAFFRAGYSVAYVPIKAHARVGKSHINLMKDGVRFLLIIFKIGTLYSPLKLFFPISFAFFLTALGYYSYTYFSDGRFTNMGMLLFVTSILIFLMGLVSEQITALMYKDNKQ